MSLPHYFLQEQIISREKQECFALALSADDLKHMKVARVAPGEHIAVVDASSDYFECELVDYEAGAPLVRICQKLDGARGIPHVTLVQGLAKGEKMELVIRHATELGVETFVPLKCQRCVMKLDDKKAADRVKRWNAVAKSAAMQSGQTRLSRVDVPATIKQFVASAACYDALLVCWEEAPTSQRISDALTTLVEKCGRRIADLNIAVVVGPEGGLASDEVELLLSCDNAHLVSLGSSILRTETAGIVAPALVLYSLGQLGGCILERSMGEAH